MVLPSSEWQYNIEFKKENRQQSVDDSFCEFKDLDLNELLEKVGRREVDETIAKSWWIILFGALNF